MLLVFKVIKAISGTRETIAIKMNTVTASVIRMHHMLISLNMETNQSSKLTLSVVLSNKSEL